MSGHGPVMDQIDDQMFTPAAAAKHAGCGRSSIMRALQNKEIKGERDNRNRWKISRQALEDWMKKRPVTDRTPTVSDQDSDRDQARSEVWTQLAVAEATIEELKSKLAENDQRHDREIGRIDSSHAAEIARLERIIERLSTPSPTLIQRIFGASPRS